MPKTWSSTPGTERTERAACALCGADDAAPRFACTDPGGARFAFVRCRRCGLVYQDPRPVPEDLHRRLKARAAMAGTSLSDYLLNEVRQAAERPTRDELRRRLASRAPVKGPLSPEAAVREERDSR